MPLEPHEPDRVEIHDSRRFYTAWCVATAGLAVAAATVSGWGPLVAIVFGAHAVWALRRLFDRRPRIRITAEGIVDRNFWYSPGLMPWDEIIDTYRTRFGLIEVELKDEVAFWDRLSFPRQVARYKLQALGFGPALITPWGLDRSGPEVVDLLQEGLDAHVLRSARTERAVLTDGGNDGSSQGTA